MDEKRHLRLVWDADRDLEPEQNRSNLDASDLADLGRLALAWMEAEAKLYGLLQNGCVQLAVTKFHEAANSGQKPVLTKIQHAALMQRMDAGEAELAAMEALRRHARTLGVGI